MILANICSQCNVKLLKGQINIQKLEGFLEKIQLFKLNILSLFQKLALLLSTTTRSISCRYEIWELTWLTHHVVHHRKTVIISCVFSMPKWSISQWQLIQMYTCISPAFGTGMSSQICMFCISLTLQVSQRICVHHSFICIPTGVMLSIVTYINNRQAGEGKLIFCLMSFSPSVNQCLRRMETLVKAVTLSKRILHLIPFFS